MNDFYNFIIHKILQNIMFYFCLPSYQPPGEIASTPSGKRFLKARDRNPDLAFRGNHETHALTALPIFLKIFGNIEIPR